MASIGLLVWFGSIHVLHLCVTFGILCKYDSVNMTSVGEM